MGWQILDAVHGRGLPKLGLFAWDVIENRLTADEVYANFYDIDPAQLITGLAIEKIIGHIIEEDRELAARSTHTALLTGKLSSVVVRVRHRGIISPVMCYGRCLRDEEGLPTIFTGGVTEHVDDFRGIIMSACAAHIQ